MSDSTNARYKSIEKLEERIKTIKESESFLFNLFMSDRVPEQIKPLVTHGCIAGLFMIASGHRRAGEFTFSRSLSEMLKYTDGVLTKTRKASKIAKQNPKFFAGSFLCRAELKREFSKLDHKDEIELLEAQLNEE